jgi:hypothetical protein
MYYVDFRREGYSESYLTARRQIDKICDLIVIGAVSTERAREEYLGIETKFFSENAETTEFFRMIYKNRIERLASQFLSEKI